MVFEHRLHWKIVLSDWLLIIIFLKHKSGNYQIFSYIRYCLKFDLKMKRATTFLNNAFASQLPNVPAPKCFFPSKQTRNSVKNNLQAPARMHCGKEGAGRVFIKPLFLLVVLKLASSWDLKRCITKFQSAISKMIGQHRLKLGGERGSSSLSP